MISELRCGNLTDGSWLNEPWCGNEEVTSNAMTTVQTINDSAKTNETMPTLLKIKRGASRHTSQRFCTTFNFAQPRHDSNESTLNN
jgi:hypothetical protein